MRIIGLLLALVSSTALAGAPTIQGTYGTGDGCRSFTGRGVMTGLVVSAKTLMTPEVLCRDITPVADGYRASCPGFEPNTITFSVYRQNDGTLAYIDDYWGSAILHRCR